MKYFAWIIAAINIYLGLRAFLNVVHVLHTSKYSPTATTIFAILFLGMGIGGFYFSILKSDYKIALLLGIGPWVLALIFLLFNMITGDYK